MRALPILSCSLFLIACSTPDTPTVDVLHTASQLGTRHDYQLMAPQQALALPYATGYPLFAQRLRQGLDARGYRETAEAPLQVHYWLAIRDTPVEYRVDMPPPNPLGPYQAIHRLPEETGALRVRITDADGQVLWEAQARTALSPMSERNARLQQAVDALLEELPAAH